MKQKETRTKHTSLYDVAMKMPEFASIIVTERDIALMRRKVEREQKKFLSEIELERIVRLEKIKKMYG